MSQGWFDAHVHSSPDIKPRYADDLSLVQEYSQAKFSGFVLKSHYGSTVGRAEILSQLSGLDVVGGIALNHSVGGINPVAAITELKKGAKVIWLPTEDALGHRRSVGSSWRDSFKGSEWTEAIPEISVLDSSSELDLILELVRVHDAILATGHVEFSELQWVIARAVDQGVQKIVITHPTFAAPGLSMNQMTRLAMPGVYFEFTGYQTLRSPDVLSHISEAIKSLGPGRIILSSDAGQPENISPPEALSRFVNELVDVGLTENEVLPSVTEIPRSLFQ